MELKKFKAVVKHHPTKLAYIVFNEAENADINRELAVVYYKASDDDEISERNENIAFERASFICGCFNNNTNELVL